MTEGQNRIARRQILADGTRLIGGSLAFSLINKAGRAAATLHTKSPENTTPDKIYYNGKIVTVDNDFTIAEAVAIKGDSFQAVGTNKQILGTAGANTEKIDLKGKTVIPGLIEAHCHADEAALSELEDQIPDVHTVGEVLDSIAAKVKKKQAGEWIVYPKLFSTRLRELRWPRKKELDRVAPDNPVFLDGSYAAQVNSCALRISNITKDTDHKSVLKDGDTGEPTGFLRRSAFALLKDMPPTEVTYEQRLDAIAAMIGRYNSVGITGLTIASAGPATIEMFGDLCNRGKLTARVLLTMHLRNLGVGAGDRTAQIREKVSALGFSTGFGNEWVRAGDLKYHMDGGILTGTAYLRQPWAKAYPDRAKQIYGITDSNYRGVLLVTKEQLVPIIKIACELGWRFTAHCTGGGGVDVMLDAYEEVNKVNPIKGRRFSIIHGNFFTKEAIERMKKLGIYADCQPAWFYKDADAMKYVLGGEVVKTFHPYKSLFDAGVTVNGGSDHMVKFDSRTSINPYNPFLSMWSVITRKTESGSVINRRQGITREQALRMYTINNAYASFEENIKGSIEPGKLADMVVLSSDILTCPEDAIKNIKVEMTMVGGKIVYG